MLKVCKVAVTLGMMNSAVQALNQNELTLPRNGWCESPSTTAAGAMGSGHPAMSWDVQGNRTMVGP